MLAYSGKRRLNWESGPGPYESQVHLTCIEPIHLMRTFPQIFTLGKREGVETLERFLYEGFLSHWKETKLYGVCVCVFDVLGNQPYHLNFGGKKTVLLEMKSLGVAEFMIQGE